MCSERFIPLRIQTICSYSWLVFLYTAHQHRFSLSSLPVPFQTHPPSPLNCSRRWCVVCRVSGRPAAACRSKFSAPSHLPPRRRAPQRRYRTKSPSGRGRACALNRVAHLVRSLPTTGTSWLRVAPVRVMTGTMSQTAEGGNGIGFCVDHLPVSHE